MNTTVNAASSSEALLGADAAATLIAAGAEDVVVSTTPGIFTRMATAMERNPVKTSVGTVAAAAAVGYGAYNLYQTGDLLGRTDTIGDDNVGERANAVLSFFDYLS